MTLGRGWVQGILLTLNDTAALATLDAFEEYDPDTPEASEYQRLCYSIYNLDRTFLTQAWVYTMSRDQIEALGGKWLPDGYWSQAQS